VRRLRSRLTYANVASTLALVIALAGGTAFAIDKINGSQIKNHSIPASKLKRDAIVPHARISDQTAQLVVSHRTGSRTYGGSAKDAATGGSPAGIVKMSVGDTVTVLEKDPFTFTASCTGDPNGSATVIESVSSSEDWTDSALKPHSAGEQIPYFTSSNANSLAFFVPAVAVAASGAAVVTGVTEMGVHAFGADCVIYQYLVG
jgi:hypothetical protein